jgi:hypothetical protein
LEFPRGFLFKDPLPPFFVGGAILIFG